MYYSGLDAIESDTFKLPPGKGALVTNMSAVSSTNNYAFDILPRKCIVKTIFSPEHGLFGVEEAGAPVSDSEYAGIPVISLYGDKRAPSEEDLEGIDFLIFDIQDTGLRIFTYLYTMTYCMKAAGKKGIPFYLLDQPNPLNGDTIEGNSLKKEYRSFVGMYAVPQRYGLTIGEFARYIRETENIDVDLIVVPLGGWSRDRYLDEYKNNFNHPSPNLPSFESVLAYGATSLFEGTNISEGRGTAMPFLIFGAPWIEEDLLLSKVLDENFPGISWKKILFKPAGSKHAGTICHGLRMYITDREKYTPIYTGLRLVYIVKSMYPLDFKWQPPFKKGQKPFIEYLTGGNYIYTVTDPAVLSDICTRDTGGFREASKAFRIYD